MTDTIEVKRGRGRPPQPEHPPTDAVRQVREKMKWSQQRLASELKCSMSTVRRLERERSLPSFGLLRDAFAAVAQDAGVSIEETTETQ